MDLSKEFNQSVEDMECNEWNIISEFLHEEAAFMDLPPLSPLLHRPTEPGFNTYPQPVEGSSKIYGGCDPQNLGVAADPNLNMDQAAATIQQQPPKYSQMESVEYLPSLMAVSNLPGPSETDFNTHPQEGFSKTFAECYPPNMGVASPSFKPPVVANSGLNMNQAGAPIQQQPQKYSNMQPVQLLPPQVTVYDLSGFSSVNNKSTTLNLFPVGVINGNVIYEFAQAPVAVSTSAASHVQTSSCRKRGRTEEDDGRPYVKRPPNAFIIFRKEQRPNVVAELNITDCATVNKVLGQKWKMMSRAQQAKYFEDAAAQKVAHNKNHPNWSYSENYGMKRKRDRRKNKSTASSQILGEREAGGSEIRTPSVAAVAEEKAEKVFSGLLQAEDPVNLSDCDVQEFLDLLNFLEKE